jgi:hypothetical protein
MMKKTLMKEMRTDWNKVPIRVSHLKDNQADIPEGTALILTGIARRSRDRTETK